MEIQDIPFDVFTEIDLNNFDHEKCWHIKRFMQPHKGAVYFLGSKYLEPITPFNFLGGFNLNAKIGDTCRLLIKSQIGYPSDDTHLVEYWYNGFYMWEGQVTELLLRESSCRIGMPVRKVLFEKSKKKPPGI
jgi:hypothetical protein